MNRCVYCGNKYEEYKDQCPTCGGREFKRVAVFTGFPPPRPLPLRTIHKGQKPSPKPLPPAKRLERTYKGLMPRRLAPDESLIYKPYDDGIGWVGKLWLVLIIITIMLFAFYFGGCSIGYMGA